ncbi:MAG: DsbE family thiol:disulfide interchange protein [Pseudomonas shahriarae]
MRILKALLLPFLLIVSLIGVDKLHGPRPAPLLVTPAHSS